jgi:outer membrane protein W
MRKVFVILIGLFLAVNVFGQEMMSGISYNMGLPNSMTRSFVQNYSWRGFGFEVRSFRSDNLSVGGSFSWNIFAEKTDKIIYLENGAASGTQIRSLNVLPLMLNSHYYLGTPAGRMRPYVGINVGTYYIVQRLEIGVLSLEDNNWHFGLAPEFGIMFSSYSGTIFFVNARYNYAFKAGQDLKGQGKDWAYWGINVGVSFSYNAW